MLLSPPPLPFCPLQAAGALPPGSADGERCCNLHIVWLKTEGFSSASVLTGWTGGTSYRVVAPAVGHLWPSPVSQDTVLHALHTGIFPQVPKWWFIFFDLCKCKKREGGKRVRLDEAAAPWGPNIHDSQRRRCAPNENCRLQLKIAPTTRGSCAAQSWAGGIFAEEEHARNYYHQVLTLSVEELKGSRRRSAKGRVPVQLTPGQDSNGAGV